MSMSKRRSMQVCINNRSKRAKYPLMPTRFTFSYVSKHVIFFSIPFIDTSSKVHTPTHEPGLKILIYIPADIPTRS